MEGSVPVTQATSSREGLTQRIRAHEALVGIIGLGYVGLPLALTFAERGFNVLGFDVDPEKVAAIGRGEGYIKHLDPTRVTAAVHAGRLSATVDFARLGEPDAILICVPTPLTPQREPDMTYVVDTARKIEAALRPGQLVVLESTTYPGTTDELVRAILEKTGLRAGSDFFLAFSPEREDPGNARYQTATIPKVVGGVDEGSAEVARALYDEVIARTVAVSSARSGRGGQADGEHLPRGEHRARQRAEGRLRRDGHRRVGGDRRGVDQALRLHALQPRARAGAATASRSTRST